MRKRRIPQRMCVGCGEMKPKKEMIRVVRTPEGQVEVDPVGKRAGRGAYVCPTEECLSRSLKGKRLQRALDCEMPEIVIDILRQAIGRERP